MKVILTRDVPDVGRAGTVLNVAPGYARNFLYPRGLALEATDGNLRQLELKRKRADELAALDREAAAKTAKTLQTVELRFTLKADGHGHLYGSVSQADIATALAERGIEIDRRRVLVKEHIKKIGSHIIDIRLHGEVIGKVQVIVQAEAPPPGPKRAAEQEETATEAVTESEAPAAEIPSESA